MEQQLIGHRTRSSVSTLALGTGRLGIDAAGQVLPGEARRILDAFADAGGTFVDASSAYMAGAAEETIGAFLHEAGRERFVIATKYGLTPDPAPSRARIGLHRAAMLSEVEGSLKRLRTDRIDVYMPHFDDGLTPIEEIMAGLDDLVRAGKVVHIGLSNFPAWRSASAATLSDLRGRAGIAVLQLAYSLLERSAEREHLPLAHARGMSVMGYSPFAGGELTARLRARANGVEDTIAAAIAAVAVDIGCTPASVALAWVRAKGVIAIIGPRDGTQLAATLASVSVRLSPAQVERLDAVTAPRLGQPYEVLAQVRTAKGLTSPSVGRVL